MKKLLVVLTATAACTAAQAEPRLVGQWQSDREHTMAFAQERAKLEDKTKLFLGQMMGRMTLRFDRERVRSDMPDWRSVNAAGEASNLIGFSETRRYKVLGKTASQIAITSVDPSTRQKIITVYNFDNDDRMWVYLGGTSFPQMNIREYFVRVR